jgi:hypothetical protein
VKKRKTKPATVKGMARRRGLVIHKAMCGGWYVSLNGTPDSPSPVLYCSHSWDMAKKFIKKQPIIIRMYEDE